MSNFTVQTPTLGLISIIVQSSQVDFFGQTITVYRATARVQGVGFQAIGDSESAAYINILQAINLHFETA